MNNETYAQKFFQYIHDLGGEGDTIDIGAATAKFLPVMDAVDTCDHELLGVFNDGSIFLILDNALLVFDSYEILCQTVEEADEVIKSSVLAAYHYNQIKETGAALKLYYETNPTYN